VFNDHAGINLTESKLQIVEICYKNDSFYLENVDQIVHSEPLIPDMPEDNFIKIIQDSFNKIQNKKPLATSKISFALPNNFFKIFEVPYEDSLVKKDLNEHFRWELSVLYANYDKSNFYIQHIEVDKSNVRQEKKAIILAIEKNCVSYINKFCQRNNLELKYIDNVHLASNAFLYLNKNQPHEISLSIYIDQKFSSISAMEGVSPFYFKVLNPSVSNIFEELTSAVNKLNEFNITLKDFQQVLLYGQDITDNFENKLKDFFGLPLKKINPFERLKKEETMLKNPYLRVKSNSFTAAAGIAIRII
jgi:Tfp pilus assembly PilM family ATPase